MSTRNILPRKGPVKSKCNRRAHGLVGQLHGCSGATGCSGAWMSPTGNGHSNELGLRYQSLTLATKRISVLVPSFARFQGAQGAALLVQPCVPSVE